MSMDNSFAGMTPEQIVSPNGLPTELTLRPSLRMHFLMSPVAMRWYQSLADKKIAGDVIIYFLEKGLREAFGLPGQFSKPEVTPIVAPASTTPSASSPDTDDGPSAITPSVGKRILW